MLTVHVGSLMIAGLCQSVRTGHEFAVNLPALSK